MASKKSFMKLDVQERWLLIKSVLVLNAVQIALLFIPFKVFKKWSCRMYGKRTAQHSLYNVLEVINAMEKASFHTLTPATCLHQTLAIKFLLRGDNRIRLQIGVKRPEKGRLAAHAWIEMDGQVVGNHDVSEKYTSIWLWE